MPESRDYIPKGDEKVLHFAMKLVNYSQENYERWRVPSPKEFLELPLAEFMAAKAKFDQPNHGKIDIMNKRDTKAVLIKAMRVYIQGYVARNPLVTDEDRKEMSLSVRDEKPTPHPVPAEKPDTEVIPKGKGAHQVTAINPESRDRKKPRSAAGVAFARKLRKLSEPVARAEDMPSEIQASASKSYQYAEGEYGMVADYACSYVNSSGKRGPWSNVTSMLISG